MEGYELVTSDDDRFGRVVAVQGENLLVEHGRLLKSRRVVPLVFADADDAARVVRVSLSKEILDGAPEVGEGAEVDERAVGEYYGLATGAEAPQTEGYGDMTPDDPARTAEVEALRTGVTPGPQERAETRKRLGREGVNPAAESPGRQIIPDDPHR